ncbi:hypothetical protein RRF57_000583 [Xylaria bambusicola]|uniref:Uncharacterized protein n=1 Tax=Xylaria bambusicola TaxID=326684 RepID=A0AAN7UCH6_9PEZI
MASPIDHGDLQGLVDVLDIALDVTKSSEALADFTSGPITAAADPSLADIVAALNSATGGTSSQV